MSQDQGRGQLSGAVSTAPTNARLVTHRGTALAATLGRVRYTLIHARRCFWLSRGQAVDSGAIAEVRAASDEVAAG